MKTLFDVDEKVYKTAFGCYWKLINGVPCWKYAGELGWNKRPQVSVEELSRWICNGTVKEISDEDIV